MQVGFYTNDSDGNKINIGGSVRTDANADITDGEWHVYVIDYSQSWRNLGDETMVQVMVGGPGATAVVGNVSFDVAYAAVCETFEDVCEVVGEENSVIYTNNFSANPTINDDAGRAYGSYTGETFSALASAQ